MIFVNPTTLSQKFIEIRKAKLERKIENEKKSEVFQLVRQLNERSNHNITISLVDYECAKVEAIEKEPDKKCSGEIPLI